MFWIHLRIIITLSLTILRKNEQMLRLNPLMQKSKHQGVSSETLEILSSSCIDLQSCMHKNKNQQHNKSAEQYGASRRKLCVIPEPRE